MELGGLWWTNVLNSALPPQRHRPDTWPEHEDPVSHKTLKKREKEERKKRKKERTKGKKERKKEEREEGRKEERKKEKKRKLLKLKIFKNY